VFVEMGEVVNAVGLRGELKLLVTGNIDEDVLQSEFLRMRPPGGPDRRVQCTQHRWKGRTLIVRIHGVEDRDRAEELKGQLLGFGSEDYDQPGFPKGDELPAFVYHDLEVVTTEGERIGRVDDVWMLPANRVLRVLTFDDDREILVPVIDDFVREVDRSAGRVVIEPVPGLLDD